MKKNLLMAFFAINVCGGTYFSQTNEHEHSSPPIPDDIIIQIANNTSGLRNFSSIIQDDYPNVTTFDLVQHQNPSEYLSSPVGDTIENEIPDSLFSFEGLQFSIKGTFQLIPLETNGLIIQNDTLDSIQRFQLIENYSLVSNNEEIATYKNTYYSFFDKKTNQLVFEVFNKNRYLKGEIYYPYNGISYSPNREEDRLSINLSATPNPSEIETSVHFDLWKSGVANISISNQNGTVNQLVFSGNVITGNNDIIIPTQDFIAGSYVLSVAFEGKQYSTTLIIL